MPPGSPTPTLAPHTLLNTTTVHYVNLISNSCRCQMTSLCGRVTTVIKRNISPMHYLKLLQAAGVSMDIQRPITLTLSRGTRLASL